MKCTYYYDHTENVSETQKNPFMLYYYPMLQLSLFY